MHVMPFLWVCVQCQKCKIVFTVRTWCNILHRVRFYQFIDTLQSFKYMVLQFENVIYSPISSLSELCDTGKCLKPSLSGAYCIAHVILHCLMGTWVHHEQLVNFWLVQCTF